MLSISGLQVGYGAFTAVHGLDLEVGRSDIFALLGANGAGKTSTLMALAGHAEVKSGQIVFDGRDITGLPAAQRAAAGLAIAPEGRRLFADLSVAENLVVGGYAQPRQAAARNRARVIELFPRLGQRLAQTAGTLSGGEQQMLAIARALMGRPRLLLLDEPSLGLAPMIVKQIFAVIRQINKEQGITVLLVEQNAFHALRLADRGYVMANGQIEMQGSGAQLLADEGVRKAYLEGGTTAA